MSNVAPRCNTSCAAVANGIFAVRRMRCLPLGAGRGCGRWQASGHARPGGAWTLVEIRQPVPVHSADWDHVGGGAGRRLAERPLRRKLATRLEQFPVLAAYGKVLAIAVWWWSFLLFAGIRELVPKRLALGNPEGIARAMAGIMTGCRGWPIRR